MKQLNFGRIKAALKNIENESAYYVGGTLCIDFKDLLCVCLNLNGRGFAYNPDGPKQRRTFLVTREIQDLIKRVYLKHKGRTPYFENHAKKA